MSQETEKQERGRLQHAAEHERPNKRNSVLFYLVILFAAAFVLLLFTFLMERRQYQLLNQQNEAQIDDSQQSVTAVQSLSSLYEENAALKEEQQALEEENQRLTGSRQEQMAHCDEISQTIQEIRMGELSAQKDRDTLLAAVAGLEERKRDSAGAVERLRGEIAAYGEKLAQLERDRQAALARSQQLRDQAQAQRQSLEGISQKRAQLEQEAVKLREQERETTAQRENVGRELARLQERSDSCKRSTTRSSPSCGRSTSSPAGRRRSRPSPSRICPPPSAASPS